MGGTAEFGWGPEDPVGEGQLEWFSRNLPVGAPWININTNTGLASQFAYDIFNHNYIAKLHTDYLDSNPFKHAVVEKLFQDELL